MPLTDRETELALQKASPKTIVHQGHTFTATLFPDIGDVIRLKNNQPGVPHGIVAVDIDHHSQVPDTVFGYALGTYQHFHINRRTIKNGLTLEQAIAACYDAPCSKPARSASNGRS